MRDRQVLSREVEFLRQQITVTNDTDLDKQNIMYSSRHVAVQDIINSVKHEEEVSKRVLLDPALPEMDVPVMEGNYLDEDGSVPWSTVTETDKLQKPRATFFAKKKVQSVNLFIEIHAQCVCFMRMNERIFEIWNRSGCCCFGGVPCKQYIWLVVRTFVKVHLHWVKANAKANFFSLIAVATHCEH